MAISELLSRINTNAAVGQARNALNDIGGAVTGGLTGLAEDWMETGFGSGGGASDRAIFAPQFMTFPGDNQDMIDAFIRFQVLVIEPGGADPQKAFELSKSLKSIDRAQRKVDAPDADPRPQFNPGADPAQAGTNTQAFKDNALKQKIQTAFGDVGSVVSETLKNEKTIPGDVIDLYLPVGISVSDGVNVENVDLGRMGGAAEAGIQNTGSIKSAAGAGLGAIADDIKDMINGNAGNPDIGKLAALKALEFIPGAGDEIVGGVKSALRITTNPNTRALFKSVNLRSFTFSFNMQPTSRHEAIKAAAIIRLFRTELYPETISESKSNIPLGYRFPNTFQISLHRKKGANPAGPDGSSLVYDSEEILTKFLPCYLTNVSATYGTSGPGLMENSPASMPFQNAQITLSFQEQKTLDKGLVLKGY